MAYVHSLVRWSKESRSGWIAPCELGDATPSYVSFVVPVNPRRELIGQYTCELAQTGKVTAGKKKTVTMLRISATVLSLTIDNQETWFVVTPPVKSRQRLRYLGTATHEDFAHELIEIEPRDLDAMDRLCEEAGLFVIGCDPFVHYDGVRTAHSAIEDV